MKKEKGEGKGPEGSPEHEASETPEYEAQEQQERPEEEASEDGESSEGVKVPEAFQQACHELISECDDEDCLDYLSSQVSKKRTELMKKEASPSEFSSEEMPTD